MDFTTRLGSLTAISATWTVMTEGGETALPTMLLGPIDVSNLPVVRQQVQGGEPTARYLHHVEVTTSDGQVVVGDVHQNVQVGE